MTLGEKLCELRKRNNISQIELAEELYVSRQTISRWEQDAVTPSTENLLRISKKFGVPLEELVNGGTTAPKQDDSPAEVRKPEEKPKARPLMAAVLAVCALIAAVFACIGIYVMNLKIDRLMPEDTVIPMEDLVGREVELPTDMVGHIDPIMP